ncbi:MAG: hypothetical protein SV375_21810 [Thermodesulfobacteriota bacterium]|nr:hypothetical protein [Thermodesulfobacteriota bacterium]
MAINKTTVLIDENLFKKAIQAIGAGLPSLVQRHNRESLRQEMGTFEMDLTFDKLERLRNDE